MKRLIEDPGIVSTYSQRFWSLGFGFQDAELERRFVSYRQQITGPIIRVWALFGTAAVIATLVRREWSQWAMNLGFLIQALRFLALRYYAGMRHGRMVELLQMASFPVRAAALCISSLYHSEASQKIAHLIPLLGVYDTILFPCIEQGQVVVYFLLNLATLCPAWIVLLSNTSSLPVAALMSLGMLLAATAVTFAVEVFNRRRFLMLLSREPAFSSPSPAESSVGQCETPGGSVCDCSRSSDVSTNSFDSFDEMSDDDLMALREAMFAPPSMAEVRDAMRPLTTLHVRLPDGDPDQLLPGAKERLVAEVQKMCPGLRVLGCVVRRGSLLLAVDVVPSQLEQNNGGGAGNDNGDDDNDDGGDQSQQRSIEQQLARIMPAQWLTWLGLPDGMALTAQVVHHANPATSLFAGVPLVAVLPSEASSVALPCGALPAGQSLRATYHGANAPVTTTPATEPGNGSTTTAEVALVPGEACKEAEEVAGALACARLPGLLVLECWSSVSHRVEGSAPLLVMHPGQEAVAEELAKEVSPAAVGLMGKAASPAAAGDTPCARQLVATLGWWLDMTGRAPDAITERDQQLLLHVGTRLLRLLVHQGRPATSRLVLERLLAPACGSASFEMLTCGDTFPQGRSLLHLALLSGSRAMLDEAVSWEPLFGVPWRWDVQDREGTTPLHIAALVDGGRIVSKLLATCDAARTAWTCVKGGRGLTPAQLADRVARMVSAEGGPSRDLAAAKDTTAGAKAGSRPPKAPAAPKMRAIVEITNDSQASNIAEEDEDATHSAPLEVTPMQQNQQNQQQQELRRRLTALAAQQEASQPQEQQAVEAVAAVPLLRRRAMLAVLFGFEDKDLEGRFHAFRATVLANVSAGWCLTKIAIFFTLVLRSFASRTRVATVSLALQALQYGVLWLALQHKMVHVLEPYNMFIQAFRYVVHGLWAAGVILYPFGTEASMVIDHQLFSACEIAGVTNFEQIRFSRAVLLHATGILPQAALNAFLSTSWPLARSVATHSLALTVRFCTEYRHRFAFLRMQQRSADDCARSGAKEE